MASRARLGPLAGTIGARFRDLARHDHRQARYSVDYLGRALVLRDAGRVRNRALDLISLARAYLLLGEPEQSAGTVVQALPLVRDQGPAASHASSTIGGTKPDATTC